MLIERFLEEAQAIRLSVHAGSNLGRAVTRPWRRLRPIENHCGKQSEAVRFCSASGHNGQIANSSSLD